MSSPWENPDPDRRPVPGRRKYRWLWLILGVFGVLLLIRMFGALSGGHRGEQGHLLYLIILLLVFGSTVVYFIRANPGQALRQFAAWAAIFAGLVLVYSFRHDAEMVWSRISGELLPHKGQAEDQSITFTSQLNGHFVVEADVEGTPIRFLVDTGASDVTLSAQDAKRLGYDPENLTYSRIYQTANGTVFGAPVTLRNITIGPIEMRNVRASVNSGDMGGSLLGMSFLSRLSAFEMTSDRLILKR